MLQPLRTCLGKAVLRLAGGSCEYCNEAQRAGCLCSVGQAQLQLKGAYSTSMHT